MASDTVTLTITAEGDEDELEVPRQLVAMLREDDDETVPEVVGDVALMSLAQRIHSAAHHAQGEPSDEIAAVEGLTMELFEERFGQSFGELTGHSH